MHGPSDGHRGRDELQRRCTRKGDQEVYHLSQEGYQNKGAFRADFSYSRDSNTYSNVEYREGGPRGLELVKDLATSPGTYAVLAGGATSGLVTASILQASPRATLAFTLGTMVGTGLLALGACWAEGDFR